MASRQRQRHQDRVAGVNARFQPRRIHFDHIEIHPAPPSASERLHYGECGGFGAPQAMRNDRRRRDAISA